jgi:heat shock protein HtpX
MFFFSLFAFGIVYLFATIMGFGEADTVGIVGFALIFIGISNFISWYFSDKIVLAVSGAKPVTLESRKDLYRTVENLCIAAGLPLPKIYIIEDSAPNAFATGRDPKHGNLFHYRILSKLNKQELEG